MYVSLYMTGAIHIFSKLIPIHMATNTQTSILLLLLTIILSTLVMQGSGIKVVVCNSARKLHLKGSSEKLGSRRLGRVVIGSTTPNCTYNECRGCKYKCRAEQVPVEGNDPINSPYRYKCVCHR